MATDLVRSRIDFMSLKHHAFRPSAERLEDHIVLSYVAPAQAFTASGSPIVETLTTDKTVYKVGQPIHITLTATNTTNTAVVLANMNQGGGFAVSRKFKNVWETKRAEPSRQNLHGTTWPNPHHQGHLERPPECRPALTFGTSHRHLPGRQHAREQHGEHRDCARARQGLESRRDRRGSE